MKKIVSFSFFIVSFCALLSFSPVDGQEQHPIFSETGWVLTGAESKIIIFSSGSVPRQEKHYEIHSNGKNYYKSEYAFYNNEPVAKCYGVRDEAGNLSRHWCSIEKDGVWYTQEGEKNLGMTVFEDGDREVIEIVITLENKEGNVVVWREVRPKP